MQSIGRYQDTYRSVVSIDADPTELALRPLIPRLLRDLFGGSLFSKTGRPECAHVLGKLRRRGESKRAARRHRCQAAAYIAGAQTVVPLRATQKLVKKTAIECIASACGVNDTTP